MLRESQEAREERETSLEEYNIVMQECLKIVDRMIGEYEDLEEELTELRRTLTQPLMVY